jgi:hypothetical protein
MNEFEEVKIELDIEKVKRIGKEIFEYLYSTFGDNIYEAYYALRIVLFFFEQNVKFAEKEEKDFLKIAEESYKEFLKEVEKEK